MTISGPGGFRLKNPEPWIRWLRENQSDPEAALIAAFVWNEVLADPFIGVGMGSASYIRRRRPKGASRYVIWGVGEDEEGPFVEILAPVADDPT